MKRLLAAMLALMMLFTLAAFGGSAAAASDAVGTYKLSGMVSGDESYDAEYLDALEVLGLSCMLYLNEDGSGLLVMFDESMDLTWDDASITAEGESIAYTIEEGVLTMSEEGMSMTFTKISDEVVVDGEETEAPAMNPIEAAIGAAISEAAGEGGAADVSEGGYYAEPLAEGDIEDYHVAIVGAEAFTDSNDKDAVRFYYEFTNNSDEPTTAWWELNFEAEQEGYELVTTYAKWNEYSPEDENEDLRVMPGATILCVKEFNFKPTGGELTFSLTSYYDDAVSYTFEDASNLPGRPMAWTPAPVEDPQTYIDYPLSGETENIAVSFTDAEIFDFDGGTALRIYLDVTNKTEEADSAMWITSLYAYQDGVELATDYNVPENDTDDAYWNDIEPGDTMSVSYTWVLRSDNPVEVVVTDYVSYSSEVVAAATIDITE